MPEEAITCFESLHALPWHIGSYAGEIDDHKIWKGYSTDVLQQTMSVGGIHIPPWPVANVTSARPPQVLKEVLADGTPVALACNRTCADNLRIGVWDRTEAHHPRHIVNLKEVVDMLAGYTSNQVLVYSLNSKTPAVEQLQRFLAFDIMVTPHGSHMTNMVFSNKDAVVVEVMCIHADNSLCFNGGKWTRGWIQSLDHLPVKEGEMKADRVAVQEMHQCKHNTTFDCPRERFKNSNILVDLERLRMDFELAIGLRCNCRSSTQPLQGCSPKYGEWRVSAAA